MILLVGMYSQTLVNLRYNLTNRLIDFFFFDVVSKNEDVLLNIAPKANGEIPESVKERFLEMRLG